MRINPRLQLAKLLLELANKMMMMMMFVAISRYLTTSHDNDCKGPMFHSKSAYYLGRRRTAVIRMNQACPLLLFLIQPRMVKIEPLCPCSVPIYFNLKLALLHISICLLAIENGWYE